MTTNSKGLSMRTYNNRMDLLEAKLEQIERTLSNKADEVVSLQILEHRNELEDLVQAVSKIETHLQLIDEELSMLAQPNLTPRVESKRKGSLAGKITPLFS